MREHEENEPFLRTVAAAARRVPPAAPDLDDRIMAAVRAAPAPRPRRWWFEVLAWLTAPRTVNISPLGAAAVAAGLLAVVLGGMRLIGDRSPAPAGGRTNIIAAGPAITSTAGGIRTIRFVLMAPNAGSVALVGDFNHWSPTATPLRPTGVHGVWTVDVSLPAGRHEYSFVVDGDRWVADPAAPRAPVAEFGTPNSVITVTPELS